MVKQWILKVCGYKSAEKAQATIDMLSKPDNVRTYDNVFRIVDNEFGTYNLERFE